ncbi:MAG: PilZ domain-containing protein [Deltaproteobacteria bacterium]
MNKRCQVRTPLFDHKDVAGPVGFSSADAEIVDISASGACIVTPRVLEQGKKINFSMRLSDCDESLDFVAIVKWARPDEKDRYRVGLHFLS